MTDEPVVDMEFGGVVTSKYTMKNTLSIDEVEAFACADVALATGVIPRNSPQKLRIKEEVTLLGLQLYDMALEAVKHNVIGHPVILTLMAAEHGPHDKLEGIQFESLYREELNVEIVNDFDIKTIIGDEEE